MWSKEDRDNWNALDEAAERAGGYVTFTRDDGSIREDIRGILAYAEEKGIRPIDMTPEERGQFITRRF